MRLLFLYGFDDFFKLAPRRFVVILGIDLNDRSESAASQTVDRLESELLLAVGFPWLNPKGGTWIVWRPRGSRLNAS